jgi:hypothetical protein
LTEGVASACSIGLRAATAEEQKVYADALATFQKMAPPATITGDPARVAALLKAARFR